MELAKLTLNNGDSLEGTSPKWQSGGFFSGELVFTTGMTGYVETLTDPSYAGQIVTFTYPLIGNYGVFDPATWEGKKSHVAGVVTSSAMSDFYHEKASMSFLDWLKEQKVPLITEIDTRALTKKIRSLNAPLGAIDNGGANSHFIDPNTDNILPKVSRSDVETIGSEGPLIVVVDCGIKENILRCLSSFPVTLKVVPHDYDYSNEDFDALFISNGPGDPAKCAETIDVLKKSMEKHDKPIFGICLGAQLLALAIDGKTYKLPFGHRGQNQPVINKATEKCYLTSQNHGYAIDASSLSTEWEVTFTHLNDDSVQGIKHKTKPYFAVQFHPEACPGPEDTFWLFEQFYNLTINQKSKTYA